MSGFYLLMLPIGRSLSFLLPFTLVDASLWKSSYYDFYTGPEYTQAACAQPSTSSSHQNKYKRFVVKVESH